MHPRLLTIPAFDLLGRSVGPFTLHTYGVLLAIAFLAGLWVVSRQAKRAGLDANRVTDMAVWVLIAGPRRREAAAASPSTGATSAATRASSSRIFQSGGVFYGGLIGGDPRRLVVRAALPACPAGRRPTCWRRASSLGQAIGRLGCFAAGCCWGKRHAACPGR